MTDSAAHAKSIGPYPIEREVGRGGMGIVYLGRDTRLDRPVAIKVLPDAFAADPDRLARFEREARLLASLSHPHIAAIYGLEESSGRRFLVLEYVEGETLAQRLARGPLPVDEAVEVCGKIAAALEAAHESGIVHRDLKPGNVKLTPNGDVKVLDFGLAKGGVGSSASSDPSISASPTLSHIAATGAGVILGTAAYMSPEQARGKPLDRRTDIWSFGCVLYECLTGRQAFTGETVSDLIAVILQGEPDWKALPASTPPRLRELLARCLTKDPKKRLRDIGEARLLLESGDVSQASGVFASVSPAPTTSGRGIARVLAVAFALSTLVLAALLFLRPSGTEPVRRVSVSVPTMAFYPRDPALVTVSPDGARIASSAGDSVGSSRIWVRSLEEIEGRTLPGTEDGTLCDWSPDGRVLAFTTQDKLKKVDLRGGAPEPLCPVTSYGRGLSWGSRGIIVFSGGAEGPLFQVSSDGGTPAPATRLGPGETGHRFPKFLPDGRHFLYASMPARAGRHTIWIGSTDDAGHRRKLMEADGVPVYVDPGWLLFVRNDRVVAQRFHAGALRLEGKPIAFVDEPRRSDFLGAGGVVAGRSGPFAYFRTDPSINRLIWTEFSREREALPVEAGPYESVALSPDGEQAVLVRRTSQSESDLWLLDLRRMVQTRFTFGPGRVDRPVFSPDGTRIAYSSNANGPWDIYVKAVGAAGSGTPVLASGPLLKYPNGWTPDGRTLLIEQIGEKTGWDVAALPLQPGARLQPLYTSGFDELNPAVSPDGHWIAFVSNESGRSEIYVDAYPGLGRRNQVSTAGGTLPFWSHDGREIVYLSGGDGFSRLAFDPVSGRALGKPRAFSLGGAIGGAMAPDFRRALAIVPVARAPLSGDITLVESWRKELKRR